MCICPYFIHNRIWRRLLCLCFDIESTFSLWSHFFCLVSNSFPNKPGKNGWEDETKKVLRQTVLILYYVLLLVRREPRISCCCCWYLLLYMLWFNQYFALQTIVLSSDSDLSLYMLGVSESLFLVPHKKKSFLKAINEGKNLNFWLLLHMPRPISSSILSISTVCVYNNWLFWGVTLLIQPGGILTDSFWIFFFLKYFVRVFLSFLNLLKCKWLIQNSVISKEIHSLFDVFYPAHLQWCRLLSWKTNT